MAITSNSDFLFLYEAINCNPNGDPDQENKPRMDYDTNTNLVTDVRIKRYIRDYLKGNGKDIFVDMESSGKVDSDSKLEAVVERSLSDTKHVDKLFAENDELKTVYNDIISDRKEKDSILKHLQAKENTKLNYYLLTQLVKHDFIDIRMFGSAFAVKKFTKAFTGPIQLNWGYSLNKVQLIDSNSIVTIMNDDSSTFGKDYRLYYSLLAFTGTINKNAAKTTGLTDADLIEFRKAIWESIPASPTRSKLNQYPKFYLEIKYNDGYSNGYFGDLRQYVKVSCENYKQVRTIADLTIDFSALKTLLEENQGEGKDKAIMDYKFALRKSNDIKWD